MFRMNCAQRYCLPLTVGFALLLTASAQSKLWAQSDVKLTNPILSGPGNSPLAKPEVVERPGSGSLQNSGNSLQNSGNSLAQPIQRVFSNQNQQESLSSPSNSNLDSGLSKKTPFVPSPAFGPTQTNGGLQLRGFQKPNAKKEAVPKVQNRNPVHGFSNNHLPNDPISGNQISGNRHPVNQPQNYPGAVQNRMANPTNQIPRNQNGQPMIQHRSNQSLQNPMNGFQKMGNGLGFSVPRPALPPHPGYQRPGYQQPGYQQRGFPQGNRIQPVGPQIQPGSIPNQTNQQNAPNELLPEGVEVIRERYTNGAVRIERQVILDKDQNYINHGTWKFFLPTGRLAALAQFDNGKKTGAWSRWLTAKDSPLFRQVQFRQFQAPFLSTFHYQDDVLQGKWKLADSANRTVFEINLVDGKRDAVCTWFFVNGKKLQEIQYDKGTLNGPFRKWNVQGQLVENRNFIDGREVGHMTEFHRPGVKKLEYGVLAGRVETLNPDKPWNLEFAVEKKVGQDIKNGTVTAWFPNGQIQFTGRYDNDLQNGKFAWFYETGQKQAEGDFENDQRSGSWVWWHKNGMRASTGSYVKGLPEGDWQWWLADGKLSRTKTFDQNSVEPLKPDQMKNASFRKGKTD